MYVYIYADCVIYQKKNKMLTFKLQISITIISIPLKKTKLCSLARKVHYMRKSITIRHLTIK